MKINDVDFKDFKERGSLSRSFFIKNVTEDMIPQLKEILVVPNKICLFKDDMNVINHIIDFNDYDLTKLNKLLAKIDVEHSNIANGTKDLVLNEYSLLLLYSHLNPYLSEKRRCRNYIKDLIEDEACDYYNILLNQEEFVSRDQIHHDICELKDAKHMLNIFHPESANPKTIEILNGIISWRKNSVSVSYFLSENSKAETFCGDGYIAKDHDFESISFDKPKTLVKKNEYNKN